MYKSISSKVNKQTMCQQVKLNHPYRSRSWSLKTVLLLPSIPFHTTFIPTKISTYIHIYVEDGRKGVIHSIHTRRGKKRSWIWMAARLGYTKSNRMRSLTDLYLTPLRSCRGTARMPCFSSHTGKTVCPPKSCFSDMSYSWTSTLRRASSGTVRRNVNSSSHIGTHWSSITLVFFITLSAFTPAIPTCTRSHHCNFTLSTVVQTVLRCKVSLLVR